MCQGTGRILNVFIIIVFMSANLGNNSPCIHNFHEDKKHSINFREPLCELTRELNS